MCSGDRSSSAKGAIALRASPARGWSTSRSRVLSDWTIRGPSLTTDKGTVAPMSAPNAGHVATPEVSDEDFAEILATTRDFLRTKVLPRENEIMTEDRIPDDLRAAVAGLGLFGFAIPQRWGGLGLDGLQEVEIAMELGYTSIAVRSMIGTNNGIAGQVLVNYGTDEQREQWLTGIASGEVVASFALTEPGAGSNPAGLRTRAVRDGAGEDADWVLDGSKRFITNAPLADLFVTFARTREATPGDPGIEVFLVPASADGVEVSPKDRKMGQEGAWTADVSLTGVRLPASALVGGS